MINNANILRENRKTIKIVINESGQLNVFCPKNITKTKINEILESKEKILMKKLNKIKATNLKFNSIINYDKILLLGKKFYVIPTEKVGKGYFTEDSFLIPKKYFDSNREIFFIKKTLREIATKIIESRVENLSKLNKNYKFSKIMIGNFKAKWGSCDSLGVLKFNWRLVMLNSNIIDFVIFHELTHLLELNHSRNFYYNLEKVCPNWKNLRRELKEYSFLLNLYN